MLSSWMRPFFFVAMALGTLALTGPGYAQEVDADWWGASSNYSEDEWYDPTDWFDNDNSEYGFDRYEAGWNDDADFANDWFYDYYDAGYYGDHRWNEEGLRTGWRDSHWFD